MPAHIKMSTFGKAIMNFPDATSKFNTLPTGRGYNVLLLNPNPPARRPPCLSVADNGLADDVLKMARR